MAPIQKKMADIKKLNAQVAHISKNTSGQMRSPLLKGNKMSKRYLIGSLIASTLISACAQQPSAIAPADVSRDAFAGTSCKSLAAQLYSTETKLGHLSAAQKAEANKDAAWVAGGALLFVPAMAVAAMGEDHAGEIATLKGEKNAISSQMIAQSC